MSEQGARQNRIRAIAQQSGGERSQCKIAIFDLLKQADAGEGAEQPVQCLRLCAASSTQFLDALRTVLEQIGNTKNGGRADRLCAEMPGRKLHYFEVERQLGLCCVFHSQPYRRPLQASPSQPGRRILSRG